MTTKTLLIVVLLLLIALSTSASLTFWYRGHYLSAREHLSQQLALVADMQQRMKGVTALDEKYTQQLKLAQTTVAQLERDLSAGKQRLQLAARCPAAAASGTTGVDDAKRPRLTDAAQRDYFTLRERIETARLQINGLQDYIRQQCLR